MTLDNKHLYPRIEQILARQTSIDDKNQFKLDGVKRSFVITLTPDDMLYFNSQLVFDTPTSGFTQEVIGPSSFGESLHRKPVPHAALIGIAAQLQGATVTNAADNTSEMARFAEALTDYISHHPKMGISFVLRPVANDDKGNIRLVMTPQPYIPPRMAQISVLLKELQKKLGTGTQEPPPH